ncbi:MAG: type II toxin-antitoxin system VapC family toxin [Chitinophagaceae bacterium]
MGIKYLWDTNIAIYYLQQQFPTAAEKFIDDILKDYHPIISAITEIELLCWKTATDNDLKVLSNFINASIIIELEKSIKQKTAEIRKVYNIKLPDAIIAATALIYNLSSISRNVSDFSRINGIKIINPWNL